jgi:serpin B
MTREWLWQAVLALLLAAFASTAARADEADNRSLVTAFNTSGHDLLKQFVAAPGNVVFSPYSIGSAMSMVLSGAEGDTATEMASVLHQRLDHRRMDTANANVLAILKSYSRPAVAPTCPDSMSLTVNRCEGVKRRDRECPDQAYTRGNRCIAAPIVRQSASLNIANAVMLTRGAVASDTYIKRLEQDYAAEVFRNFQLDELNGWVKRMTEGKIDQILDQPVKKGIVLIDAVYFKQAWRTPFAALKTENDDFHLSPKSTIKVATMHQRSYFPVVSRPGYRAIRLPYLTGSVSMVVILPDAVDGATALAQRLDTSELAELFVMLRLKEVYTDLSLPRFKTSFAAKLKSTYRQQGLMQPFDEDRADFSGISGCPKERVKVWIDDILHRAALEVTEQGIEAAAATATSLVEVTSAGRREPPLAEPFTVDRPFLFYITDDNTGVILFEGRISDPSKTN